MRSQLAGLSVVFLLATAALAQPDVNTIIGKMKQGLEPAHPSLRTIELVTSAQIGAEQPTRRTARQARKNVQGHNYFLTTMVSADGTPGFTLLVREGNKGERDMQWVYLPTVRRVMKMSPTGDYQSFADSDFTYADLGFVNLRSKYKLLGTEQKNGVKTYKVQATPPENWYFSRVITWVDANTFLPVAREYYDPANQLWKAETFDQVSTIDGTPTVLHLHVDDKQMGASSDMNVSAVSYDVNLPDDLFDPTKLGEA